MQRKLVQMGKHCLMAAIPKSWLKHHDLQKGDYIAFEEVEQYLLVSPNPLPKDKSISIQIKDANKTGLFRILELIYDAGFKTVTITYDRPEILTWLLWCVKTLEEWQLNPINEKKCVLKSRNLEREEFQVVFRRAMLLTRGLGDTFLTYLKGKRELEEEIRVKHSLIMSNTLSIKRMINTSLLPLEFKYYYFIAIQLEEIANHYEYLLRNLENKRSIPGNIIDLQKKLNQMFDETYANFYCFNLDWFIDFNKKLVWKWFETEKNSLLVYHQRAISERIKNIAKYTVGIRLK